MFLAVLPVVEQNQRHGGELKLLCPSGRVLQVLNVFHLLGIIPS
jgi:hypothetical protein